CILSEAAVYGSAEFSVRATTGSKYAIGRRCTPNNPTSLGATGQGIPAQDPADENGRQPKSPAVSSVICSEFARQFSISLRRRKSMTSMVHTMSRSVSAAMIGAWVAVGAPASARANVITDWDEKAVAIVTPMPPYTAQRVMGMVHIAMFDAVNSIERRCRPYVVQLPADPTTSKEAAAASAAAAVLATIDSKTAAEMKIAIASYLASIPDGAAKSDGVKLGEAV